MKTAKIRQSVAANPGPLNVDTTDGRIIHLDHPESAIVTDALLAIGSCLDGETGIFKDIVLISHDHVVRIEPAKRKPMRKRRKPLLRISRHPNFVLNNTSDTVICLT
jgi:hypothetical protein